MTMTEYQIQPNTRRCAITGRELKPGERCFTALREEGDRFVRQDYAREAWKGPPEGTFSFWSGVVAAEGDTKKLRFDDDLLEECFHRLEGQLEPGKVNFRYVIALLLMRRKRLRFDKSIVRDGEEVMQLTPIKGGDTVEVVNPRLSDEAMAEVQDEVFRVLGWN